MLNKIKQKELKKCGKLFQQLAAVSLDSVAQVETEENGEAIRFVLGVSVTDFGT